MGDKPISFRDENGNYGVREYCNTGIQVINMVK